MGTVHQNGWTCQKLWKTSVPELFKCSGCQINVWWSCDGGWKLWRNIFVAGAIPVIILGRVNAFGMGEEHERPEFIPYEHLRIRTKKFPWEMETTASSTTPISMLCLMDMKNIEPDFHHLSNVTLSVVCNSKYNFFTCQMSSFEIL